jgi:hypothetical protein
MANGDPGRCATIFPWQNMALLAAFIADVVRLCARQHMTFIDHWRLTVVDLMPDNLHIGACTKRHTAATIVAAIAESEPVYSHAKPRSGVAD